MLVPLRARPSIFLYRNKTNIDIGIAGQAREARLLARASDSFDRRGYAESVTVGAYCVGLSHTQSLLETIHTTDRCVYQSSVGAHRVA